MNARSLHPSFSFHNIHYAIKPSGVKPVSLAITAMLIASLWSASADAQQNRAEPIRIAIAEVRAEEAKGRPLVQRMQQLSAQNVAKKKDYDAADAQQKTLQPRIEKYNATLAKYDGEVAAYAKAVDAFNGKCGGNTPLPADKYRACLAEKGELAGRRLELDQAKGTLETERVALTAELKTLSERLTAISREMAANVTSFEKAQGDYKLIYARIESLRKRLVELCASGDQAKDPFAVRLCV